MKKKDNFPSHKLIKQFVVCAESENYNEALEKLDISSGTLSLQMDLLEQTVGEWLFLRKGKKRTNILSQKGAELYEAFKNLEKAIFSDKEISSRRTKIKILMTSGLAKIYASNIISMFDKKTYQFTILTHIDKSYISGEEFLIRSNIAPSSDVVIDKFCNINFNLYGSKNYLDEYGVPKVLDDLSSHVLLSDNVYFHYETYVKKPEIDITSGLAEVGIVSDSVDVLIQSAKNGHGLVQLPNNYPGTEELIKLDVDGYRKSRNVYIGYNKILRNNPQIKFFIDELEKHLPF